MFSYVYRAVSTVAPRSVMVCGNTTTTAGLTVTLTKETGSSGNDVAMVNISINRYYCILNCVTTVHRRLELWC